MVYQLKRLQNNKRPQAFWGALIPSAINFVGGLITSSQQAKAQKRALEEQKRLAQQQLDISNQNQLASTLNNYALAQQSYDDKDYNLKYRIGGVKRLGGRNIMITDGGNAKKIGNNTYLLRGGSHEDINETGQTGIGINVGGNEIEAEGGEVAQRKGNSLRIYSAQPILGGISPAEAIMRGYNKDKVFNAQQRFKKNNGIKDDGTKQRNGGLTSKDRGSSKHPYPSVSSKDFAGGNRSYPIPTKADAIDALRLAGLHGRSDVRSKVYNKYPELRKKADFGTWVRSNRNNNVLANFLYESGIVDKDAWRNMLRDIHTFTGIGNDPYNDNQDEAVMTPAFGVVNQAQILRGVQQANKLAQATRASQAAQRTSYAVKQAKDFYRDLGINIPVGRSQTYNPAFRSSALARNIEDSNKALQISLNNTHLPKGIRLNPIDQSSIGRTAARVINPREAELVKQGINITRSARNMTSGLNPFLYAERTPSQIRAGLNRAFGATKQGVKNAGQKVKDFGNKVRNSNTYRTRTGFEERYNPTLGAYEQYNTYKLKPWVKATAGAAGTAGVIGLGVGLSNTKSEDKSIKAQLDVKGQPISPYIARPQEPVKPQAKKVAPARKDTTRTDTTKQVNKVGNFNQAFDAARAAGRNQFIYRASKYQNYSTNKETDAKKEALNRRVGARRIAKRMGGLTNPPVESFKCGGHIRPKAVDGMLAPIYSYGTDKRRLPSFAPIDVTPRAIPNFKNVRSNYYIKPALSQLDTNISFASKPNTTPSPIGLYEEIPVNKVTGNTTPFLGRQSSFKPATQDYIGLGIDTLAALGSGMFTRSAYNRMNFDYALPNYVDESPVAFDTTYHNEAQRANIERNRLNSRNLISGNTSSAQTALGRMQQTDTDAMMETNKLLDEKSNKEVELRNQNLANEQQVRARNAAARNQYYQSVAQIKNAALEAKNNMELARAQSIGADLSGLSQAWSNFAGSVEQRYNTRQNEAIIAATSKDPAVLSNAVQFGYNFSPEVLAAIYNSTDNDNLKSLALSQLSTKNRLRYGIR